jgi:deoxycytidylate deaminase
MNDEPKAITHPELVIGIAGPIGIDVNTITEEIRRSLYEVGYNSFIIRVTDEMKKYPAPGVIQAGPDYFNSMTFKMDYANRLCQDAGDSALLMRIAIQAISILRDSNLPEAASVEPSGPEYFEKHSAVLPATSYVIRQLKRPSEVSLLRRIYGKQFILVSAYGSEEHRRERIRDSIRDSMPISTPESEIAHKVEQIISRDYEEEGDDHGQHLRDTFHLADVFVDGINKDRMKHGLNRFFQAFFGRVDIGPTKSEYGMYAAKGASLRSTDLSRQVGAAIFSPDGELITQGCNEVPKAFGGTYWDGEEPDFRDVQLGYDPNDHLKKEVMRDLLERLSKAGLLTQGPEKAASDSFVDVLLGRGSRDGAQSFYGCLRQSQLNDLTEYGRVVHAEMVSICDAARLGKGVKGAILFCTTFPCHNCTKHILAAGIRQVVFMEPYPKSRAKRLHKNEIEIEKSSETRVSFVPFLGISPFRYRDIFEKKSRKSAGKAIMWYRGTPRPLIEVAAPAYLDNEFLEISKLGGSFQPNLL